MDIFDHHSSLCGGVVRACLPGRVLRRLDGGGDEVVDGVAEEPQGDAHRRLFGNNGGNSSYGDWWKSLDCPYQHHSQPADSQGLVHFTAEVLPSVQAGGGICVEMWQLNTNAQTELGGMKCRLRPNLSYTAELADSGATNSEP